VRSSGVREYRGRNPFRLQNGKTDSSRLAVDAATLMSATNAISGISLVGSLVTAGAHQTTVSAVLGFIAVVCSTTNVVGGFVITDRMLKMFKRKATPAAKKDAD
jgi:NAD/NADP transhydrogenase alpha subunit